MENKRKQIQENIDTTKQNLETESLPGFIEHWTPWDTHRGASSELGDVWCDREQKISQLLAEDDAVQAREGKRIPQEADISTLLRHMKQLTL